MKAERVLDLLRRNQPKQLAKLPKEFGIYALWDHKSEIRYIGCTYSPKMGFRKRIFLYHKCGNEGQSHKFTQAYCCGRMWRYKKAFHGDHFAYLHDVSDADISKKLRNRFIERFCRATHVSITGHEDPLFFDQLRILEAKVQALAEPSERRWESKMFREEPEPEALVNSLLDEGVCGDIDAIERQRCKYNRFLKDR